MRQHVWSVWLGAVAVIAAVIGGPSGDLGAQPAKSATTALEEAARLDEEVLKLLGETQYDAGIPVAERALAIREKALGPDHPEVANSLNNLAGLYHEKGDYVRAEPLYQRALAIAEKAQGPDHPEVAALINNLAGLYDAKGDYARAEPLYERALAIREKALGPDHPEVANSLNNLAGLYDMKGDYVRAEPLFVRALAILEKALGPDHRNVAQLLLSLADLYRQNADYVRAEPLLQRALAIFEKTLGPEHPNVAASLNTLALLYKKKGDYVRAEPLYRRALGILEKALGPDHPYVAGTLNSLALLYYAKGDYARVEPLLLRAQDIWEKALGPSHPNVATALSNLAGLYDDKGDYVRAESLYQRALGILEKALGPDHPNVATLLNNLAELYRAKGDYAISELLYKRALAIDEKALGPDHPDVATPLSNLGGLCQDKGDYARAESLYRRTLAIREKALGPDHPDVAHSLQNLATLYLAQENVTAALMVAERAADIRDRNAVRELLVGADEQRRAYMQTLRSATDGTLSVHVQFAPQNKAARDLAFRTILRRKGLVLDAMADSLNILRRRLPREEQPKLEALHVLNTDYSLLALRGPGSRPVGEYRSALKDLDDRRQRLENELSFRIKDLRIDVEPVAIDQVRAAIPERAALVELFRYHPFHPRAKRLEDQWGAPRYVVYVLRREGEITWADLGEASVIETVIEDLLTALRREAKEPKPAARKLDALVMQPIRRLLGDTRWVFLSPDAQLNLIPFGALLDEQGHYLVEQYSFTYLTSGRDLVRMAWRFAPREVPVIVADPDYGDLTTPAPPAITIGSGTGSADEHGNPDNTRSAEMGTRSFGPLLFATQETAPLRARLGNARLLQGADATEAAVKRLHGPKLLHIVTHGFFLEDQKKELPSFGSDGEHRRVQYNENPLLRSGLALAGANRLQSGKDDGILTALEVAQVDLDGTKLVVLSACETGVGKAQSGDAVYGLRRSLVIAGAESQIMSLWKVDDSATSKLMAAYYDDLLKGGGRSEALRQVQLAMLHDSEKAHPYFWAGFIVSGDPASLDGTPVIPKVQPGLRGCGCEVAGTTETEAVPSAWAALIGMLAWTRLRRRSRR